MAVFIRGSSVQTASGSNNNGVFIGQNIQHSWDTFVVEKQAAAYAMGDGCWMPCGFAAYLGRSVVQQSIRDEDVKDNFSSSRTR